MPEQAPTPGQVAYAAYRQRLQRGPYELRPWALLARRHQHAWDAAAQAVIVHYEEDVQQRASLDMLRAQQRGPANNA